MKNKRSKPVFKRRREGKTDYKARIALLKSGLPRIVIRKSNKYIVAQLVKTKESKDFVLCNASSKELVEFGWVGSFKNIPAAYLTGILLSQKIKKLKEIKSDIRYIVDIGLYDSTKGSKLYSLLKGITDSGLDITVKEEMFPQDEKIKGSTIKNQKVSKIFNEIKDKLLKQK